MRSFGLLRIVFVVIGFVCGMQAASAAAQSQECMLNVCASPGQGGFLDPSRCMDMRDNGQRFDGPHVINGRIVLETRSEDFACFYVRGCCRMAAFLADGRIQSAYLPGGDNSQEGSVFRITGLRNGDMLNVRSGAVAGNRVIGALTNGRSFRSLGRQMQASTR